MRVVFSVCVLLVLTHLSLSLTTSVTKNTHLLVLSAAGGGSGGGDASTSGLSLAHQLTNIGFTVHGFFEDVVVVSTPYPKMLQLLGDLPVQVHFNGELDTDARYYVLERPDLTYEVYTSPVQVPDVFTVLYSSHKRVVLSVPHALTPTLFSHTQDMEVVPIDVSAPTHLGVRSELVPLITSVYGNATRKYLSAPDPVIEKLVDQVDPKTLRAFVTYLTGEDTDSNILTRNSRSQGALDAQAWLEFQFGSFGLNVTTQKFNSLYSSNVIGVRQGVTKPEYVVVVGAHYDSRGPDIQSTTQRAPGANDNGSGTGAMLQIAKIFNDSAAKFDFTIHFIVYSGEEQGLLGSAAYAQKLLNEKVQVVGVLNADMIAFRIPGEHTQCAFPSRYSTPDLEVLARTAVYTYVPELTIGITTACCSDHQSYYNKGLPATGFFERNGAIADDQYHKSADLVARSGYDVEGQYTQLTKGVLATLATLAGVIKS